MPPPLPAAGAAGARCCGRTGVGHPWPATLPRSRWGVRPAEALAYTRVHPEVMVEPVVDPAASDRHRATSASVAVGSLHTNDTAHRAGLVRNCRVDSHRHRSAVQRDWPPNTSPRTSSAFVHRWAAKADPSARESSRGATHGSDGDMVIDQHA